MPSLWIDALKQFNFERGAWSIPRKDSDDYVKVRALMADKAGKDAKKAESPKMIKEHERLAKVLEQGAKGGKDVKKVLAKEAKIQKKELKEMKK